MGVLVNGNYKNYTSVRVNLLGVNAAPYLKAISYKTKDEFTPVKVLGTKKAVGFTQGNEENEGSVTFTVEFLEQLQRVLPPGQSIKDIPLFSISIGYVDEFGLQISHKLKAKFTEDGRSSDSGSNDALMQEIPLFIFDIDWNA